MKIFLSVSYSTKVDEKGDVQAAHRKDLEALIGSLEDGGHKVFCAPREEGWKINKLKPIEALKWDLDEIDKSDLYVAVLNEDISSGVQLETGYALAKKKRIILASPHGVKLSWTNNAVSGFEDVSSVNFDFYDELAAQISQLVTR